MIDSAAYQFIWGFHPVREALRANRRSIRSLYLVPEKSAPRYRELLAAADQSGIPCLRPPAQKISSLIGHGRHQGIAAEVSAYPTSTLEQVLSLPAAQGRKHFILILDQILDPQNLGAIARTAYCVGVQGLILPKNHSAPPTPAAVHASAGALEHLRLAYVVNLTSTINILKQQGIWIVGADRGAAGDLFNADLKLSLALIIGGEEKGIRPLVKRHCDFLVSIPQMGDLNSLNASAAAAVMLYECFRQVRTPAFVKHKV